MAALSAGQGDGNRPVQSKPKSGGHVLPPSLQRKILICGVDYAG